jgi:hypothetical protein
MLVANYKLKKDLQTAVGEDLNYTETSMFGTEYQTNGSFPVVGPSADNRKWFATVTMKNDKISKVE